MITELSVFPQCTFTEQQGFTGTRRWSVGASDNVNEFVRLVGESHWPGRPDCLVTDVQLGALWDEALVQRPGPRTAKTLGPRPVYNAWLVIAKYAIKRTNNCWPTVYPKPKHYPGTTLSLRVRGSGQFLLISPAGLRTASMSQLLGCEEGEPAVQTSANTRIVIPTVEYHLTCGRMTLDHVRYAQVAQRWAERVGTVNDNDFLGCRRGTLLFESWELEETFVPHNSDPYRYEFSCTLRQRNIRNEYGELFAPLNDDDEVVGWNQDFISRDKERSGWYTLKFRHGSKCLPRYPYKSFEHIFYPCNTTQTCGEAGSEGVEIGDWVCGSIDNTEPDTCSIGSFDMEVS